MDASVILAIAIIAAATTALVWVLNWDRPRQDPVEGFVPWFPGDEPRAVDRNRAHPPCCSAECPHNTGNDRAA